MAHTKHVTCQKHPHRGLLMYAGRHLFCVCCVLVITNDVEIVTFCVTSKLRVGTRVFVERSRLTMHSVYSEFAASFTAL